jgi:phosphoribosylaminoimidazolecarboxamide formyltransferase/IMP cyclohydrolase
VFAKKKNLRLLLTGELPDPKRPGLTVKPIAGGLLVQNRDNGSITLDDLKVVTKRQPTEQELTDALFAWTVAKHVKSNAIVYAKDGITAGIGAGQMNRRDSSRIAAAKAGSRRNPRLCRCPHPGQRGCLGRFLPLRRRPAGRCRSWRDHGDPAGRLDARR